MIHDSEEARRLARRRLPAMVFDYIDGNAGQGHGAALNARALADIRLTPRVLVNVAQRDLEVQVFDHAARRPFGIAPMGLCNLATPGADLMLARLAARDRVPLGVSTMSSTPLEKIIAVAEGHAWFQLYHSGDGSHTKGLMDRARAAGYRTLVLTVDVPEVGRRPRELRRGFTLPFRLGPRQLADLALHPRWALATLRHGRPQMANFTPPNPAFDRKESRASADWDVLARLRDAWAGNLVVKGVLHPDDAQRLQQAGVDAVQVSGHGGRQLDSAPPPILALRDIRAAVGPGYPLFYDSGLRSGEDVIKAYALGADFVFFGRPLLFALAAAGAMGLGQLWQAIGDETGIALALLGRTDMRGLDQSRA